MYYPTLPHPTLDYPTLPPTLPYYLPYHTQTYPTLPPTLPYPILFYPTPPYPTLPYPTLTLIPLYPTLPYPTLTYPCALIVCTTQPFATLPILPYLTPNHIQPYYLPYPLSYPNLPKATLPYPTLPFYPTLPYKDPTTIKIEITISRLYEVMKNMSLV